MFCFLFFSCCCCCYPIVAVVLLLLLSYCCCCCSVPPLTTPGVTSHSLYAPGTLTNAFPVALCVPYFTKLPHGQPPHAFFGGFILISGGWMLLCKELTMAKDHPHITMQRITALYRSLGVVGGVSVL